MTKMDRPLGKSKIRKCVITLLLQGITKENCQGSSNSLAQRTQLPVLLV